MYCVAAKSIVILTGAGISAESGLGTFRDVDGLWTRYDLSEVATPQGYARNPQLVLDFYNARRRNCLAADPHDGHMALARLTRAWENAGHRVTLVTQNVDDLHERGGSTKVIHMHGELLSAWRPLCDHRFLWREDLTLSSVCAVCDGARHVRPDIVWFGEIPYRLEEIETALSACDLFVAIGTSGNVYPAAGFVREAAAFGAETLEINLEPSEGAHLFDHAIYGPARQVLPAWADSMIDALHPQNLG